MMELNRNTSDLYARADCKAGLVDCLSLLIETRVEKAL